MRTNEVGAMSNSIKKLPMQEIFYSMKHFLGGWDFQIKVATEHLQHTVYTISVRIGPGFYNLNHLNVKIWTSNKLCVFLGLTLKIVFKDKRMTFIKQVLPKGSLTAPTLQFWQLRAPPAMICFQTGLCSDSSKLCCTF